MQVKISLQDAPNKLKPFLSKTGEEISQYLTRLKAKCVKEGRELIGFLGDGRPVCRVDGKLVTVRYSYLQILHQGCFESAAQVIASIASDHENPKIKKYLLFVALKLTKEMFKACRMGKRGDEIIMTKKWYKQKEEQFKKEIKAYKKSLL